jgi:uncharacterized protein (TIGR02246 family)
VRHDSGRAINKGDLEAAIALYEPTARFVQESGEVVTGHQAIREKMKGFLAIKPKFRIKVTGVQSADRNIALTQAKSSVTGTDADGKPVTMSSRRAEVVRGLADGTWKFVIDNPRGGQETRKGGPSNTPARAETVGGLATNRFTASESNVKKPWGSISRDR